MSYFPIGFLLSIFSSFFVRCFFLQPRMKNLACIFSKVYAAPPGVSDDCINFDVPKRHGWTCSLF